ncbi:4-hydroxy-tetrahydrodipicolinate reductase [Candidatus Erwinia haradaeae]|uniref:4-hydroxy-tetrahydrodipicolinate reductase n=2 Tax=Candidatus Erwinia haradaeae TaxID=1922217 RepID=A0A451D2M6_9GAMM|nr:4-hydroxy-tetrahydrodipicolinate reductase [Candidatus Erwinia haradaeae]
MQKKIRIAIVGADGRMGRQLIKAVIQTPEIILGAAIVKKNSSLIGCDIGDLIGYAKSGITITDNINQIVSDFDTLIDFTHPAGTLKYLNFCYKNKKAMIIGTTGFDHKELEIFKSAAKEIAIVHSANFSIGANIILKLAEKVTKIIGEHADIDILEKHHREKIDSPSGTALEIGKTIAKVMNWDFSQHIISSTDQLITPRLRKKIHFTALRYGDIVGEHKIIFSDIGECIEINHKVSNRLAFAQGALKAALWLRNNKYKSGYFNMIDVLNLSNI